jgi:hypothetical protein
MKIKSGNMEATETNRVAAIKRMEIIYYTAHPRSPSAMRWPRLQGRGNLWIPLFGKSVQAGLVGFGRTVEAALPAFDAQYLSTLRSRIAA